MAPEHLAGGIMATIPVLPVGIIATLFLDEPERPLTALEIKANAHALLHRLKAENAPVYPEGGKMEESLDQTIRMMTIRHLLTESEYGFKASAEMAPLLSYYANALAHYL